jgi:hypothetical protein
MARLGEAGFIDVVRHDDAFFQPAITATRPAAASSVAASPPHG